MCERPRRGGERPLFPVEPVGDVLETPIGSDFAAMPRARRVVAATAGCAVVAADVLLCLAPEYLTLFRLVAIPASIWFLVGLGAGGESLGLRLTPIQGWLYWVRATLLIGFAMAIILAVGLTAAHLAGVRAALPRYGLATAGRHFFGVCVSAPVIEETIYRLILCGPLVAVLRPGAAIIVSGLVFAAYHWTSGVLSLDNAVAGYFLAWAYFRSGSLVAPMALHALGNLCVLIAGLLLAWWIPLA